MDRGAVKWSRPNGNWFNVNWHAALEPDRGKMGGGLVVRDHNGDLIAAATWSKIFIHIICMLRQLYWKEP